MTEPPACECGIFAVGKCVDCGRPVCDLHSNMGAGKLRCEEHHELWEERGLAEAYEYEAAEKKKDPLGMKATVESLRAQHREEQEKKQKERTDEENRQDKLRRTLSAFREAMARAGNPGTTLALNVGLWRGRGWMVCDEFVQTGGELASPSRYSIFLTTDGRLHSRVVSSSGKGRWKPHRIGMWRWLEVKIPRTLAAFLVSYGIEWPD